MSWFSDLFGISAEKPINALGDMFDNLFTSDQERLEAQAVLAKIKQHPLELQAAINKIEASHRSIFVAGWRPWIGWVCGVSLALFYIPQYALASYVWLISCLDAMELANATKTVLVLPAYPVSVDGIIELVLAMLGMAVIRQVDKTQKLSK